MEIGESIRGSIVENSLFCDSIDNRVGFVSRKRTMV